MDAVRRASALEKMEVQIVTPTEKLTVKPSLPFMPARSPALQSQGKGRVSPGKRNWSPSGNGKASPGIRKGSPSAALRGSPGLKKAAHDRFGGLKPF